MKQIPLYTINDFEPLFLNYALEEIENRNFLLALYYFDKSIKEENKLVTYYSLIEKSRLLINLGGAKQSYDTIMQASKKRPLNACFESLLESYIIKSQSEFETKRYKEAIQSNQWIIKNTDQGEIYNIDAHFRKGLAHAYLGRKEIEHLFTAEWHLTEAIHFEYGYFANIVLSEVLIKLNEKEKGIDLLLDTKNEILNEKLNEKSIFQLIRIEENLVRINGGERELRNHFVYSNQLNKYEIKSFLDEII